jgi:hypothetical protein
MFNVTKGEKQMTKVYCIKAGVGAELRTFETAAQAVKFARRVNRTSTYARAI